MVSKNRHIEINNNIWYKGNDLAQLLGYSRPRKAVIDHVCPQDNKTLQTLQPHAKLIYNESITIYINEPELHK